MPSTQRITTMSRIDDKNGLIVRGDLSCLLGSSALNCETTKRSDRPCLANAGEHSALYFRGARAEALQPVCL